MNPTKSHLPSQSDSLDSQLGLFDEFRVHGKSMIDAIADYWQTIESRKVTPSLDQPVEMPEIGMEGIGLERSVSELGHVFDNSLAMSHPLYLGLVNSSPLPQAVLGDLLVSTLDNNGGASHQGPAHVAAEQAILQKLKTLIGYNGDGLFLPGGSFVNHHALMLAREKHFPQWSNEGPTSVTKTPRLYTGDSVHFSVSRAAKSIGCGMNSIVSLQTNARGAIDCEILELAIKRDIEDGFQPFCVVATAGTTGTGAVDDLESIHEICRRHDLWLHVDTCYGGAVLLSEKYRQLLKGIEKADSIAIDLHKWFFVPLVAGVLLTRHDQLQIDTFDVAASYIPSTTTEPYCKGLPTSRRSTALGTWFGLRAAGWNTVKNTVERNIELTRYLEQMLGKQGFVVMPDGELSIACVRYEPTGFDEKGLEALQNRIAISVRKSGIAWFATTNHQGKSWMRLNMVNLHTRQHHIDRLVSEFARIAEETTNSILHTNLPNG